MIKEIEHNKTKLIRVVRPSPGDIEFIEKNYHPHPLIIQELKHPTLHPKIDFYENHLFLILHFPIFDKDKKEVNSQELDLIFFPNSIIFITYQEFENLENIFKKIESDDEFKNDLFSSNSEKLFYKILEILLDSLIPALDHIIEKVNFIESKIFQDTSIRLTEEISYLRRETADYLRIIKPNKLVFQLLYQKPPQFFSEQIIPYLHDLIISHDKIFELIKNQAITLNILHETNRELISVKINTVMKVLTIFSAILLPLNFVASLLGMNLDNLPSANFWELVFFMIFVALLMVIIFKLIKWL